MAYPKNKGEENDEQLLAARLLAWSPLLMKEQFNVKFVSKITLESNLDMEVQRIRGFLKKSPQWSVGWISRKQNKLAHSIAKWAMQSQYFGMEALGLIPRLEQKKEAMEELITAFARAKPQRR
ncbi:hypothetical protein CJ030_MR0G003775 [Morella rubra]|uniref:RNase H type-1 domain-containing protein n=1 Tax=Morella rubra TaxID=262757 RepID=A0A6A1ULV4_9ROSI|nr:hypothetical protein CJ030_MR0G003775 [Morella rubra]